MPSEMPVSHIQARRQSRSGRGGHCGARHLSAFFRVSSKDGRNNTIASVSKYLPKGRRIDARIKKRRAPSELHAVLSGWCPPLPSSNHIIIYAGFAADSA